MKKYSNYFAYLVLIFFVGTLVSAQDTSADKASVPFSNPSKPGLVEASVHNGGITVKGYDGKEVIIEAKMRGKRVSKEKKEVSGMKLIRVATTGLTIEEDDNRMEIGVESWKNTVDLTIQVPYSTSLDLSGHDNGYIIVENVKGEIEVNHHNGPLTLTNVSGSVVAHTFNGHVKVTFESIDPEKPMSFSTWNGDIDVTFPSGTKAELKMKSRQGDIYSDFDIQIIQSPQKKVEDSRKRDGKYKISFGEYIYGTINGGGPEYQFNTYNGDIYIRGKK